MQSQKVLLELAFKSQCHFIVNWMTEPLVRFLWNVFVTSINANTFTQFTIWQIPCKMPNTKSASSQRQHSLSWRGSSKNPLSKDFIFRKIPIECHHISNKVLWITFTTSHTYTEIYMCILYIIHFYALCTYLMLFGLCLIQSTHFINLNLFSFQFYSRNCWNWGVE